MSIEAVNGFWTKLDSDKAMQAEFSKHKHMTLAEIVAFGGKHGFHFTEDDLKVSGERAIADGTELNDEDLGKVAGGLGGTQAFSSNVVRQRIGSQAINAGRFAL